MSTVGTLEASSLINGSSSAYEANETELPPEIDNVLPFSVSVCGTPAPPPPPPVGADATQVVPFQVNTSPVLFPETVRLSARTAVP